MAIDKNLVLYQNEALEKPEVTHALEMTKAPEDVKDTSLVPDVGTQEDAESGEPGIGDHDVDKTRGLPIDRGWAWVVLAASMFYLMMMGGIRKNFGIFFIEFQSRFNSSASMTSLLTTTQNLFVSLFSLLVMTIGMQLMSNRTSIIIGSILLSSAYIITAYATDISQLFFSVGMLEGIGSSCIHPPVTAALAEYFSKRRGFANGIAFSGASSGGLIFAPIMSSLFQSYGYSGTLLVVAGMMLNVCITGVLLRPIKSFEKKEDNKSGEANSDSSSSDGSTGNSNGGSSSEKSDLIKDSEKAEKQTLIVNGVNCSAGKLKNKHILSSLDPINNKHISSMGDINSKHVCSTDRILTQLVLSNSGGEKTHNHNGSLTPSLPNKHVLQVKGLARTDSHEPRLQQDSTPSSPFLPRSRAWSEGNRRHHTMSESSTVSHSHTPKHLSPINNLVETLSRSRIALYSSIPDGFCGSVINIAEIEASNNNDDIVTRVENQTTGQPSLCSRMKGSFDLNLFTTPVFPMFLLTAMLFAPSCAIIPAFIAPHAKDLGMSMEQRGILLSIIAGCGLFARVSMALLADRKCVRLTTILATVATIMGLLVHSLRFFTSFTSMVIISVLLGLSCDIYQAMYPVILVEYLSLPRLKSCIGFTLLCHGLMFATMFPVTGYLRDSTGSYLASYHLLGTMALMGACVVLLFPWVHARAEKRAQAKADAVDIATKV